MGQTDKPLADGEFNTKALKYFESNSPPVTITARKEANLYANEDNISLA